MGTFGNTTQGTHTGYMNANWLQGSPFTSPSDASGATIDKVSAYCTENKSGDMYGKAVIVLDSTGEIITNGVSDPSLIPTSVQWVDFTFSTPPEIEANTSYILMMIVDSGSFECQYYYLNNDNITYLDLSNNYTTPTDPDIDEGTEINISIYATYSGGGGGGPEDSSSFTFSQIL